MEGTGFDVEDLKKSVEDLEGKLNVASDGEADLSKALADVASKALDLAKADKEDKPKPKAKAKKDDDEDEDDDDMPAWLKDIVDDGKSAGEMIYADGREETGTHQMRNAGGESRSLKEMDAVEVNDYLNDQLVSQRGLSKSVKRLAKLNKGLLAGLMAQNTRLARLETMLGATLTANATMSKALGKLLDTRGDELSRPVGGSKFEAMAKSELAAKAMVREFGTTEGTPFPMTATNKELLSKAVMAGKITQEQQMLIKRSSQLPKGLTLN